MIPLHHIKPSDFTYDLPPERIALFPAGSRDHSKLLIRDRLGELKDDLFKNIAQYLPAGGHLFFNNSKVIPARLIFTTTQGSKIELFCLKPINPEDYQLSLSSTRSCIWECLIGNARRFKDHVLELPIRVDNEKLILSAKCMELKSNTAAIEFNWNNSDISFAGILSEAGKMPLPPYIKRDNVPEDYYRYQTVYSKIAGSVAAPTAGLHFTSEVIDSLIKKKIILHEITLHVGAGTFQPVKAQNISDHIMHAEQFEVTVKQVQQLSEISERVTCVGTTTVRTLESLYWIGVKLLSKNEMGDGLHLEQWEAYTLTEHSIPDAFNAILRWLEVHNLEKTMASTKFMVVPGYKFKMTERMITNFHQPGSTLLMLIAAFTGESWKQVYRYALDNGFRFLSYGDSSLLFINETENSLK